MSKIIEITSATRWVGFGDYQDLFLRKKTPGGGTIIYTLNTVRSFKAGKYKLTTLHDGRVKVVHHEKISPLKIDNYLLNSDVGDKFKLENFINRYDWMHCRNWGPTVSQAESEIYDEKKLKKFLATTGLNETQLRAKCFFVPVENTVEDFQIDGENLVRKSDGNVIGYMFDIKREGDWNYGCVFQDKSSKQYFAFVMEDMYTNKTLSAWDPKNPPKNKCEESEFKFEFTEFKI